MAGTAVCAQVLATRLSRHGLLRPVSDEAGYVELFGRLQPVAPEDRSYPGSAPRLMHRAHDDAGVADDLRAERRLLKGRFHLGTVGYVLREDLPLYAAAYRRPLTRLDARQEAVVRALTYAGPQSPRQLRHETGLAHRPLMAAVHRLQRAFLVCEDQTDDAWDRPLHLTERELPDLAAAMPPGDDAVATVVARRLSAQVFATTGQLVCGTGLGARDVGKAVSTLVADGRLRPCTVASWGAGWRVGDDDAADAAGADAAGAAGAIDVGVRVLHRSDPLVRPHHDELRARYDGREVLQYLLIGDRIGGAVCGHWRIKPHDVEDVVVDDEAVAQVRRDEILDAVRRRYPPPQRVVRAYAGEPL